MKGKDQTPVHRILRAKNQRSPWAGQDGKLDILQEERLHWGLQGFGGLKEGTGWKGEGRNLPTSRAQGRPMLSKAQQRRRGERRGQEEAQAHLELGKALSKAGLPHCRSNFVCSFKTTETAEGCLRNGVKGPEQFCKRSWLTLGALDSESPLSVWRPFWPLFTIAYK